MLDSLQNGRTARRLRIAAVIACPPLFVLANAAVCSNVGYAIALAYAPVLGGGIGLMSRPVLDAAFGRESERYEFSGKGAIIGAAGAFLATLAFAPQNVDRSTLITLFIAAGLLYYAIGKAGCLCLGCCRAIEARALDVPLPLIECVWSLTLCVVALAAALASHAQRVRLFPAIIAALLALRVYSRVARGAHLRDSLTQVDSSLLEIILLFAIVSTFIGT